MLVCNVQQGTQEWHDIRAGVPTASGFNRIMAAHTLKRSTSFNAYARELIAESLGVHDEDYQSAWMQRGIELEQKAVDWYTFETGLQVDRVGFCFKDENKNVGCSPDGLVGDVGGLEVKTVKASTQVGNLLNHDRIPSQYRAQVYGGLYVTGREWWDFVSYHPSLNITPVRIRVDAKSVTYQLWREAFETELEEFIKKLNSEKQKILGIIT